MNLEVILADLNNKVPYLRQIFRPEYIPYLTTIATILVGWLLVSWIFHVCHLIWILFIPLIISAIAIALMCPSTSKWCFQQLETNLQEILNDFIHKLQIPR